MKKRIFRILILILIITVAIYLNGGVNLAFRKSTVQAVGDLNVDWGVPDGNPIFVVTNMLPGDSQTRSVNITNNASNLRPVAVRGILDSDTDSLASAMDIVISEGVNTLYTGTVDQFFTDSAGPSGIFLFDLAPSASKTVDFKVTFKEDSGNEFQNQTLVFDLKIGISVEVPEECSQIAFSGLPIFGTENRDVINGTNGNDLIFAFEGNDVVNSSNGDDCVVGGSGNDIIHGSNGNDVLIGAEGNDKINGDNGDDLILGGAGNDTIWGTNGNDTIFGGEGNDDIDANNGSDVVKGEGGNDKIFGGNGNDDIDGGEGNDTLRGGNNNDTLIGGNGIDSARGDLGTDTCDAETETSCEL